MWDVFYYLMVVILLAGAVLAGGFMLRAYMSGSSPIQAVSALFQPGPPRRLDVVEHANVDGRRKLILIRRDDVEHLLMTGGPVDVVIETGIAYHPPEPVEAAPAAAVEEVREPPVFSRIPRLKARVDGES